MLYRSDVEAGGQLGYRWAAPGAGGAGVGPGDEVITTSVHIHRHGRGDPLSRRQSRFVDVRRTR